MKITLSIYNIETLKNTAELIDSAVLMIPKYSLLYEDNFSLDDALDLCSNHKVEAIISLNRIYMEDELEDVKNFILKYKQYKFLVHDLGVIQIMKEMGLSSNIIYEASTMVCNSLDLSVYGSFGFDAVAMSNEIPLIDVIKSYNETEASIFYQVFGLKPMFYSKRRLLSLFEKHSGETFERNSLSIKEEKRKELMPIEETSNGYVVFRSYILSLLKEIKSLTFLKYAYFESLRLKDAEIAGILKIYSCYINGKIDITTAEEEISKFDLNFGYGFEYSDSIHAKEKIINE